MISEQNLAQRYLGARFGLATNTPNGVYAIPCETSKGKAFFKLELKDGHWSGEKNFHLFWDEALTISWYNKPRPWFLKESEFAKAFRKLEKVNKGWG